MTTRRVLLFVAAVLSAGVAFAQRPLSLEESKRLALENNCGIRNSTLAIEAARQTKNTAVTKYFPAISAAGTTFKAGKDLLEFSFAGMSMGMFKSGTIGVIDAVQPVFAGGRIWNGNRLASLGEDVSEEKSRLAHNDVLRKTEEQYWQVVSLDEKLATVRRYEDLINSLLRQVEDAYNAGLVMKNDVLKVRVKRSEVLLNKSKLENGRKLAAMAFFQHIGLPYDSTLVFTDTLTVGDLPQCYYVDNAMALEQRAEYRLLQASVRAEELQSAMALGEYLPQVGVGVGGLYTKFDEGRDRTVGMVFGTVSIPISGWWEASHTLEERSVKEQIAENSMKENAELLLLQMQKAWQDLTDAYKQYLLSEESLGQANENLKVNSDSYKNGLVNVSDMLEAQALQQKALNDLTDAKADYVVKKTVYMQVTGR